MKYLHSASNAQINKLLESQVTIGEMQKQYQQPPWCSYPGALDGEMGCRSLMDLDGLRKKISPRFCRSCDCFQKNTHETPDVKAIPRPVTRDHHDVIPWSDIRIWLQSSGHPRQGCGKNSHEVRGQTGAGCWYPRPGLRYSHQAHANRQVAVSR